MAFVLVQYRPTDPTCQSFDKYVEVPDGASQEEIDAAAEVALVDVIHSGAKYSKTKKFCAALDYTINYGPLLE